jgi:hypothetical protein
MLDNTITTLCGEFLPYKKLVELIASLVRECLPARTFGRLLLSD